MPEFLNSGGTHRGLDVEKERQLLLEIGESSKDFRDACMALQELRVDSIERAGSKLPKDADCLWNEPRPDRPNLVSGLENEWCYFCSMKSDRMVFFVHNEGCHAGICKECAIKLVSLFF